jgi:hypothetical protein
MAAKKKWWRQYQWRQYRRGSKYDLRQTQPAELRPELSEPDLKELARLVRKYGSEPLAAAAKTIVPRSPGRPSRGLLPCYERMHLTDWIEETAEEHRQAGSRKPYTDAEIDLYDLQFSGEAKPPDFQKWRKTIKKRRLQGRRDWQQLAQKVREQPEWASAVGQGLPSWLVGRK